MTGVHLFFIICISSLLLCLLFLVVRFVHPDIIYSVRNYLAQAKTTRAFRRKYEGTKDRDFARSLIIDLRPEGYPKDTSDILGRIMKIRQIYHTLDHKRSELHDLPQAKKAYYCITELSNILMFLAEDLEPRPDLQAKTITADDILSGLLAQITGKINLAHSDVEEMLRSAPMTIEQISEMLIACIHAILFRKGEQ